ncbi:hypothetical protein [Empedobacter tilapiae]|uniref:hypothetical protein n=1 Tax=Empedobacter tilapiae TaxID=2491114 RepID=UPI0028D84BDE|nr:hypothetical protein [Empedobacter tilapiae]
MGKILITIIIFVSISCNSSKKLLENELNYKVEKIESLNNWNIIYLNRGNSKYKLVSLKKENRECNKIKVGKTYSFILHSRGENPPVINGIKLKPINYLDINCYSYDSETEICIDPEKGINDLYSAENLNGLCIN